MAVEKIETSNNTMRRTYIHDLVTPYIREPMTPCNISNMNLQAIFAQYIFDMPRSYDHKILTMFGEEWMKSAANYRSANLYLPAQRA